LLLFWLADTIARMAIRSLIYFVAAGFCEIGGGYLVWLWLRENKSPWYAVRYHLDAIGQAPSYNPTAAGVAPDLRGPTGPIAPVLARLDPALATPINLSNNQFGELVDFLRNGLLDPKASPENLRKLIPKKVPSGRAIQVFQ
jgi:hypothetical protein